MDWSRTSADRHKTRKLPGNYAPTDPQQVATQSRCLYDYINKSNLKRKRWNCPMGTWMLIDFLNSHLTFNRSHREGTYNLIDLCTTQFHPVSQSCRGEVSTQFMPAAIHCISVLTFNGLGLQFLSLFVWISPGSADMPPIYSKSNERVPASEPANTNARVGWWDDLLGFSLTNLLIFLHAPRLIEMTVMDGGREGLTYDPLVDVGF